jgi:hypothetical protein
MTTTTAIRKFRVFPSSSSIAFLASTPSTRTIGNCSVLQPNVTGYQMVGKKGKPMIFA